MPWALPPLHLLLLLSALGCWATPAAGKTLKIGVPANSKYPKFVTVKCNWTSNETCFSGHAINVFRLVWKNLNNNIDYEFIPFYGSNYDSLIKQVYYKKFDAVVGDTSIVAKRCEYIEFSRPYTETGSRMVVLAKQEQAKAWIFVKPFTKTLWALTGFIFLFNGIIVWFIESANNEEESSFCEKISNLIWLSFTTLFPIHGERLRSNLSRMAMVVWLFVALVLTQSYTASLTSMLTVRRLRPSVLDVESLLNNNSKVGCDDGSFMSKYLEDVVGFGTPCVETYAFDQFARALSNGKIKAAFLEIPCIQLFLDENPVGYTVTGPTYEIGGLAFVFPKGSDIVEKVSDEILRLRENGTLRKMEKRLVTHKRSTIEPSNDENGDRLSPDGFWGLFLITGGMSTLALFLFLVGRLRDNWRCRYYPRFPLVGQRVGVLIFKANKINDNDDPAPHQNVLDLSDLRRCNTV